MKALKGEGEKKPLMAVESYPVVIIYGIYELPQHVLDPYLRF